MAGSLGFKPYFRAMLIHFTHFTGTIVILKKEVCSFPTTVLITVHTACFGLFSNHQVQDEE
jgi:hypothetical protein